MDISKAASASVQYCIRPLYSMTNNNAFKHSV